MRWKSSDVGAGGIAHLSRFGWMAFPIARGAGWWTGSLSGPRDIGRRTTVATIRAAYKRTFQTIPYETQVIDLAVEEEFSGAGKNRNQLVEALYRQLEEIGDKLMADALAKPDPRGKR